MCYLETLSVAEIIQRWGYMGEQLWDVNGIKLREEAEVFEENLMPVSYCPPQIAQKMIRD